MANPHVTSCAGKGRQINLTTVPPRTPDSHGQIGATSGSPPETEGEHSRKRTYRSTRPLARPTLEYPPRQSTDSDLSYALSCRRVEIIALLPWADADSSPEPEDSADRLQCKGAVDWAPQI
ncbi:hypothetical protein BJ138DRAFT_1115936 [Hygrophoropsis aurantiaca]|uniref:Uncharacterized protein n=1 Tax=Hygrophoropsis aurantiaca TaxID=72124 RepID=A0ACB8A6G6_9AGAM|nr:hypothetical protein BJ138DRAFT_1115936 [Hygrophoropsis aurantiaca]